MESSGKGDFIRRDFVRNRTMPQRRSVAFALVSVTVVGLVLAGCGSSKSSNNTVTLTGKETTFTVGPVTTESLRVAGVKIDAVPPATPTSAGGIAFPITGGSVKQESLQGQIKHSGGLTLTASTGKSVTVLNPVIDVATGVMSAQVNSTTTDVLQAKPLIVGSNSSAKEVAIFGTAVTLNTAFVTLINNTLAVALSPSQAIGTLTINATYS
jgi:hypothetical protein